MAFVAPAMAVASGALSAASSISGGMQANKSAKAQASIYEQQANVNRINANNAKVRGDLEEGRFRQQGSRFIGTQVVNQAKSKLTGVTANDILDESISNIEMDASNLEYDNLMKEYNFLNEANQNKYAAKITRAAGKSALLTGFLNGAGSIINTASSMSKGGGMGGAFKASCARKVA